MNRRPRHQRPQPIEPGLRPNCGNGRDMMANDDQKLPEYHKSAYIQKWLDSLPEPPRMVMGIVPLASPATPNGEGR